MEEKNSVAAEPLSKEFLLLYRSNLSKESLAVVGFLLVLVLLRCSALLSLKSAYLGGSEGDAGLYIWLLRSNTRDLFSLPWFNTHAFYPYTRTLAWSDNFILPSLIAWPFLKIGVPLVVAYNLLLLSAGFLNGYCTYRLAYKLIGKFFPAFIAGAAFMSYSTLSANLGHPQLQFMFWLPLALSFLFSFIHQSAFRYAYGSGLCIFLSFLCTVYYSIFIAIAVLSILLCSIILRPRHFSRSALGVWCGGMLAGVIPLAFFVGPYFAVRNTFGERGIYEAYYFSARALSYLSAPPFNLLYGATSVWSHAEANLFPGFAVLVLVCSAFPRLWSAKPLQSLARTWGLSLALACLLTSTELSDPFYRLGAALFLWSALITLAVLSYRMGLLERKLGFHIMTNRGLTACFLVSAMLFFALSLGPLANPEKGQWAVSVYRLFYEVFPGFNAIRAIGRAGIFCVFFLCMVSAFTLAMLSEKRRSGTPVLSLVLALCLLENYVGTYPLDSERPRPTAIDFLHEKAVDKNSAVVALPLVTEINRDGSVKSWSEFARLNSTYMNWLFPTGLNFVNGYSGQRSKTMKELPWQTLSFPDARSISALRSIVGLRYILYASSFDPGFRKEIFEKQVEDLPGNLSLLMADSEGNYLFELLGSSRIKTDTYLLAPSYPPGVVYVELMSLYQKGGADIPVEIYATNYSDTRPIATATVKQSGEWERFLVPLPPTDNTVRPNWLTFRINGEASVFFRESSYAREAN